MDGMDGMDAGDIRDNGGYGFLTLRGSVFVDYSYDAVPFRLQKVALKRIIRRQTDAPVYRVGTCHEIDKKSQVHIPVVVPVPGLLCGVSADCEIHIIIHLKCL